MPKDTRVLIREGRKEIFNLMKMNLEPISVIIIKNLMSGFNKKSSSQKEKAVKNSNLPAGLYYKQSLREALAVISREAIKIAKAEVPSSIKFAEFDNLPKALRDFLEARASLYVETQIQDLSKRINFFYQDELLITTDREAIEKSLSTQAANYIEGNAIKAAAGKFVANVVNNSKMSYYRDKEVMEKIEGFQYINPEPNAEICKDLQNHVFRADDPELDRYTPPFHFNCDGWLRPILIGKLRNRTPSKYTPTKKAQQSIQF